MSETLERKATHGGRRAGAGRPHKPPPAEAVVVHERRWFVGVTFSKAELWAQQCLARAGFNSFLPMVEQYQRDAVIGSMKHLVVSPAFPGYLLIELEDGRPTWRALFGEGCGIRGILGGTGSRPSPLPRGFVEGLQLVADEQRVLRSQPASVAWVEDIAPGAELMITAGAFIDHDGRRLWSDETRVKLAAQMFGEMREITVARSHVRRA